MLALGDQLQAEGDLEGALAHFSNACNLSPNDEEAWTSRGAVLVSLARFTAAAASYDRALDAEPEDADLHRFRGHSLCQAGNPRAAAECHGMGLALSTEYFDEALAAASVTDERDETSVADEWSARALALWEMGRLVEAKACFVEAARLASPQQKSEAERNQERVHSLLFWERAVAGAVPLGTSSTPWYAASPPERYKVVTLPPQAGYETNPLYECHVLHYLNSPTCSWLLSSVQAHTAEHSWSLPHRGDAGNLSVPEVALSECPTLSRWMARRLSAEILPAMSRLFGIPLHLLLPREVFWVRYTAGEAGAALLPGVTEPVQGRDRVALHRDGHLLSFNVLVSEPGVDFEGGGTHLALLGATVKPERAGDVTMHSGCVIHGSEAVTRGTRDIIVGFVEVDMPFVVARDLYRWKRDGREGRHHHDSDPQYDPAFLDRCWQAVSHVPT